MTTKDIKAVRNYSLCRANGSHIRVATLVEFVNGSVIRFTEKLTKAVAVKNALYQASKA